MFIKCVNFVSSIWKSEKKQRLILIKQITQIKIWPNKIYHYKKCQSKGQKYIKKSV